MVEPQRHSDNMLLDAALESIPYGFCVWSSAFELVMWNRHYLDVYGFPSRRISKGMSLEAVVELSSELGNHPDETSAEFLAAYKAELLNNRGGARAKSRELVAGGRWLETAHVFSPGLGWVVTHEDVTEELASSEMIQKRKRELERQNIRLDAAVNNISQGLCMYDAAGRLVICNAPYARIYRLPPHLLEPGTELEAILSHLFDQGMSAGENREEYVSWRRDVIARGEYGKNIHELQGRTILMQHHPMQDGGWVSTHEDITEQREQEERIQHLARHDALTELPNRVRFLEELSTVEAAIARNEKQARAFWALRENISEAQKIEGVSIKHDISLPVSRIPEFIARGDATLASAFPGVRIVCFGHLGDGNLHYNQSKPRAQDNAAFIGQTEVVNRIVHDLVAELGGSISAEHGLGQLKRDEVLRYKSEVEMDLMRKVKQALDPRGLMNPGKVL